MLFVGFGIEPAQKVDRLQVLPPAVLVRNPLALLARVIEIEHRRHGIYAQSIDMVFVEPEHGARQQEAPHFIPPVIEDVSVPVGMESLAPVGMLVKMRA